MKGKKGRSTGLCYNILVIQIWWFESSFGLLDAAIFLNPMHPRPHTSMFVLLFLCMFFWMIFIFYKRGFFLFFILYLRSFVKWWSWTSVQVTLNLNLIDVNYLDFEMLI